MINKAGYQAKMFLFDGQMEDVNFNSDKEKLYIDLLKKTLTASIYDESTWRITNYKDISLGDFKNPLRFIKNLFRKTIILLLKKKSLLLINKRPFDQSQRREGKDWPFIGYTMVGNLRLDNLQFCIEDILRNNIPGDLIETGVWRGGAVIFMRAILKVYGVTNRKIWVADSFEGLPISKDDNIALQKINNEYLSVSLDEIKSNFKKFGLLDEQVKFLKGWFCDTLPNAPIKQLAILRLDGDLYSSTIDSLENLYFKVSKGGYVIIDDYYSWDCCRKAVDNFVNKYKLSPEIKQIDWAGAYWKV